MDFLVWFYFTHFCALSNQNIVAHAGITVTYCIGSESEDERSLRPHQVTDVYMYIVFQLSLMTVLWPVSTVIHISPILIILIQDACWVLVKNEGEFITE